MAKFSDNEREILIKKLDEKVYNAKCSGCKENNHILSNYRCSLEAEPYSTPCVQLICSNCGLITLFSLGILNVMDFGKDKSDILEPS